MLGSIGISEWVAALITFWLAAQLPLGMLVGFYLRRATVLGAPAGVQNAFVAPQRGGVWPDLLQPMPATPSTR
jgi:hypothetical protein